MARSARDKCRGRKPRGGQVNIGLIFCGYGTRDLVPQSIEPWIELRSELRHSDACSRLHICGVSVKFAGFEGQDDGTTDLLRRYRDSGDIDHLIDSPQNIPETAARGMALTWLKEQKVDVVIQYDSDEVTDIDSIRRMLGFIEQNPFIQWFRFSYRNLVFNENTWLAEAFTPPRVFRIKAPDGYIAHSFSGDNDICYGHPILRNLKPQEAYPSQTVPVAVFNPKHFSWLSDTPERAARSKAKIRYQLEGRGWPQCSFSWDDSKGGLIFNPNLPEPKVVHES